MKISDMARPEKSAIIRAAFFIFTILAFSHVAFGEESAPADANQSAPVVSIDKTAPAPPPSPLDALVPPSGRKAIQGKLDRFTGTVRDSFSVWLNRSVKYISIMEDIFEQKGLPTDLVFLPLIESGFNPFAVSRQSATGPWQFMAGTAKNYGLAVNWWTDERRDPIKATSAAADYLKNLYNMFGSWPLALASYNAGEGRVSRALTRARTDDYWSLVQTRFLPRETKDYVPLFMAASMIAKNPREHGFNPTNEKVFEFDEVILEESLELPVAAKCSGTTVENMKDLNPALKRNMTPPYKNYVLRIPKGSKEAFVAALANLAPEERQAWDRVKVRKGDTLKRLAKKYGLTVEALKEINCMDNKVRLKAGDYVLVPRKRPAAVNSEPVKPAARQAKTSAPPATPAPAEHTDVPAVQHSDLDTTFSNA